LCLFKFIHLVLPLYNACFYCQPGRERNLNIWILSLYWFNFDNARSWPTKIHSPHQKIELTYIFLLSSLISAYISIISYLLPIFKYLPFPTFRHYPFAWLLVFSVKPRTLKGYPTIMFFTKRWPSIISVLECPMLAIHTFLFFVCFSDIRHSGTIYYLKLFLIVIIVLLVYFFIEKAEKLFPLFWLHSLNIGYAKFSV